MKLTVFVVIVNLYLFTGKALGLIDDYSQNDVTIYVIDSNHVDNYTSYSLLNSQFPVESNLKNGVDQNIEKGTKSVGNYVNEKQNNSLILTANFTSYIETVCKNINSTRLLTTVQLPNATAKEMSATVELSNGRLMDVKSILPYKDCPASYENNSYTLETRMIVHDFKVMYDCHLTVLWGAMSTNFKVAALVNDMKVDSKFSFNSTNFEIKLVYLEIPEGTEIEVEIDKEGAPGLSYIFQQFLRFVFYITKNSILTNAQNSARTFIEEKLEALPKLNNTLPTLPQLKCFGFRLINS